MFCSADNRQYTLLGRVFLACLNAALIRSFLFVLLWPSLDKLGRQVIQVIQGACQGDSC